MYQGVVAQHEQSEPAKLKQGRRDGGEVVAVKNQLAQVAKSLQALRHPGQQVRPQVQRPQPRPESLALRQDQAQAKCVSLARPSPPQARWRRRAREVHSSFVWVGEGLGGGTCGVE
jgi:hypothetical protein